jgi:hypothetical protein
MATEHLPWASGKRKRAPGKKRSTARRRKRHTLLSVLLSVAALAFLAVGLVAETLLYYLVAATFAGAVVAQRRAMAMEMRMADRRRGQVVPPKPRKARPGSPTVDRAKRMREEATAARNAGATAAPVGVVKCTATQKPTDECDCASRHVTSEAGERRYGLPMGSPLGRRKQTAS